MTEPRTEAGRRLLAQLDGRPGPVSVRDILAIEAEAAAGPREVPRPRDEGLRSIATVAGSSIPWTEETQRVIQDAVRRAAAGPRDVGPLLADMEAREHAEYLRMRAEAAAGPRDEGLREAVKHLLEVWPNLVHHPSMNPSEIVALRAALAKASE